MQSRNIKPGTKVLVTAGASGIGRSIVNAFVEDGATVHVCDVNAEALAACRETLKVTTSVTDVSSESDIRAMFSDVETALGGLDILVNNAGIAGPTGAVDEITTDDWRQTIDINLNGQFLCAHYAVPLLRRAGEAAIINMSSAAGRFGYAYRTPYAASKWAIIGFTQSLAKELGPAGIRVNAILPGIVEGPRMAGVISARAKQVGVSFEEMEAQYLEKISLRHMVSPDDVASAVVFLCSRAGWNISGQSISVCGNVESL